MAQKVLCGDNGIPESPALASVFTMVPVSALMHLSSTRTGLAGLAAPAIPGVLYESLLEPGDHVDIEVDGIGGLTNSVMGADRP